MCTTEANIDLIIVITRSLVLLMCTFFAGMSIVLGARMYQTAVSSKSHAELTAMGIKLVLKSAGPGLCLIGFGALLLAVLVLRPATLNDTSVEEVPIKEKASTRAQSLLLEPNTVSTAMLLLVDDKPSGKGGEIKKCVLKSRVREFATGQDPLSASRIKENIKMAIQAVERAGGAGVENPLDRATLVTGLRAIEKAADETQE